MDKPIKVIHKYKNNNRKVQYNVLIFVGSLLNDSLIKVLKKIKEKNFFDALTEINANDINLLVNEYGEKWYKNFFIDKHIKYSIDKIIKINETKKNELINKYGIDWYNDNIDNYNEISKTIYNYQNKFKINKEQKLKNIKSSSININNDDNIYKLSGGNINNDDDDEDDDIDLNSISENYDKKETEIEESDYLDLNDLENIRKEEFNNINEINKYITDIIDKTDIDIKSDKSIIMTKWDDSKDNNMYDELLINIYSKTYIFNQYICIDDTIKTIKNKICCAYEKSKNFDKKNPYFIPSRLYLWVDYSYLDNNILKNDKLILEYKWIISNELLNIDIEPNNSIRYYEIVKGNLKNLQDNINKYGSRITFENDENNILYDYFDYITNNEIYMIDIYNELGTNYKISDDKLKNLYDVYVRIYYYKISEDEFKNIIEYLNDSEKKNIEDNKINLYHKNIFGDLLIDNEILKTVEELKKTPNLYNNIFKENYITQSIININIKHSNYKNSPKIELNRIFDNYITNDLYPFIQLQTSDGKIIFKYHSINEKYDKNVIMSKWFENSPYGISFKVFNNNKFIAISMNENGRIDYKTQWKEDDKTVIEDIYKSYELIKNLLKKINNENNKLKLEIPSNNKFKFAFINTIQQFDLPEKFNISHNDLSDFARYFYPYVAVVIEPKKRKSKNLKKNNKSKYGTYLRFKRISKYDNETNIEKKIIYFLKNYESNDKLLSLEIAKQFNITDLLANNKVAEVISKYPNLKKSRNILKSYDNIPKYKPPGVGIDIQGKQKDKYKMRISGARSKFQLDEIIKFMNILIYLYIEIYFYKNPNKLYLKNKLKLLTHIAKRRNKVDDIVEYVETSSNIKDITKLDKNRLAYKPEKGQNQWTRNCQNSGKKRRRPLLYINIDELLEKGYVFNEKTSYYEKKVTYKNKEIVLKAAKIENFDDQGNSIFYTCSPEENGEYMYVGFLSRSANPYGLCMPCCYKKDEAESKNKEKRDFYLRCLGKITSEIKSKKIIGEKLYILQNTNKINDFRFAFLPDYLDIFLNTMLNRKNNIKNNYLLSTTGWFFKYGTKQDDDIFISTVADALDITINTIKNKIISSLLNESNSESIFMSLNNGDIQTRFKTINSYISYIETNNEIEFELIADILSIPGIVHDYGVNIIIFNKKINTVNNIKDDFNIFIVNNENLHYLFDKNKVNIILIKEDINYYPIYQIRKEDLSKNIFIDKLFNYDDDKNNIINHINNLILLNNTDSTLNSHKIESAKKIFIKIDLYGLKEYYPTKQITDNRNKCKYFIINDKYLLPVKPSGILYWLPIEKNYDIYLNDIFVSSDILYNLYLKSNREIYCKPIGIYYTEKSDDKYHINALIIDFHINIPINDIVLSSNQLIDFSKKFKIKDLLTEFKSIYDIIDKYIFNFTSENSKPDNRVLNINKNKYLLESYELFRLEISYFLNVNENLKKIIINILSSEYSKSDKKYILKKILYYIISKKLYNIFIKNFPSNKIDFNINTIKSKNNFITINDDDNLLPNYQIKNIREQCNINNSKDSCNINPHCIWEQGSCFFKSNTKNIIEFTNKIIDELILDGVKSNEILMINNYFVSDIVNKDNYIKRENQKIIRSNNNNINKILIELFGKNNIPIIGKRHIKKISKNINEENISNPLEIIGNIMQQLIYPSNSIYRAYANCIFWLKNTIINIEHRNLGYYNSLQTELSNYFKSQIIDWINNEININLLFEDLGNIFNLNKKSFVDEFKTYLMSNTNILYSYIIELYILSKINNFIILLYDNYNSIIGIFDNGIKFLINYIQNKNLSYDALNCINIKFNIKSDFYINIQPYSISSLYFLK